MDSPAIIGFGDWLETPAGRYLLDWEQQHIDRAVADIFGYHALQLGLPQLLGLRANRMGNRWLAVADASATPSRRPGSMDEPPLPVATIDIRCDFDALPFDSQSLDLVVLPHALELARDPHRTLGEVERVLRPEGRVVILGFNPASLWGLRRRTGVFGRSVGANVGTGVGTGVGTSAGASTRPAEADRPPAFAVNTGEFIGYRRLRDWLRLLSFDIEVGRFGCYRPPFDSTRWLARFEWTERWGDRWWPVFGAVYSLTAVKRVRGMRLVGLVRQQRLGPKAAPAVVAQLETMERLRSNAPPLPDSQPLFPPATR